MAHNLAADDILEELSVLQEKAKTTLDCIFEDSKSARVEVLTDIARDYLSAIGEMIGAMQESELRVPSHQTTPS